MVLRSLPYALGVYSAHKFTLDFIANSKQKNTRPITNGGYFQMKLCTNLKH